MTKTKQAEDNHLPDIVFWDKVSRETVCMPAYFLHIVSVISEGIAPTDQTRRIIKMIIKISAAPPI